MKTSNASKQMKFGEMTAFYNKALRPIQLTIITGSSLMVIFSLSTLIAGGAWSNAIWYTSGLVNNICFLIITLLSRRTFKKRLKSLTQNDEDDYRVPLYYYQIWLIVISIFNAGFTFANIFIVADDGNLNIYQFIIMGTGFFWTVYICVLMPLFIFRSRYLTPRVKLSKEAFIRMKINDKTTIAVSKELSKLKSKRKVKKKLKIKNWRYKLAVRELLEKSGQYIKGK